MDKILIALARSPVTRFGKEPFAQQSQLQKVFTAIWHVEAEVNNGGFSQYFWNISNESAHFVVEALETIGAPSDCKHLPSRYRDGVSTRIVVNFGSNAAGRS